MITGQGLRGRSKLVNTKLRVFVLVMLAAGIACWGIVGPGCGKKRPPAAPTAELSHRIKGEVALQTQDYEAAITELALANREHPQDAETCYLLGLALAGNGQNREACRQLEEAITLRPGYGEAYAALGDVYEKMGDAERSLEAYRKAVEYTGRESDHAPSGAPVREVNPGPESQLPGGEAAPAPGSR